MFAYEIPGLRFSMPADGPVAQRRFVSVFEGLAYQANGDNPVVGASTNEVTDADFNKHECVVEIADGLVMVEAGGAIEGGVYVKADSDGRAVETTDTTDMVAGVAITSATAAGELITVKL